MPNQQKLAVVAEIKDRFARASAVVIADFRGLAVREMQELRVKLREAGGEIKVYKNTLTKIAVRELEMPDLGVMLEGPTAFVFAYGDPIGPAKAIAGFAKEHQVLEIKGGLLDKDVVDAGRVWTLAALASREELVARLMGTLLGPVRGFMVIATAPAGAFVRTVGAVADQKAAA